MTRPRRPPLTCAVVAILLGAGCAAETHTYEDPMPRFRPTRCLGFFDPTLSCGYLDVPELRGQAESKTISLYVERLTALAPLNADADPEPILVLWGGPGSPPAVGDVYDDSLRKRHDIVLLSQRGVGLSEPSLLCAEYDQLEYGFGRNMAQPERDARAAELTAACRKRLTDRGIDVAAYDTEQSAHDVEALRIALGVERWNLLGTSYGTQLALEVMRSHPDGVRSAILSGTLPPQVDEYAELTPRAEAAVNRLLDACEASPECPAENPRALFRDLVEQLDAAPEDYAVEQPDGSIAQVHLDGAAIVDYLFGALYETAAIPDLPRWLVDMQEPAYRQAFALSVQYVWDSSWSDGAYLSVNCREEYPYTDRARMKNVPDYLRAYTFAIDSADEKCEAWDVGVAPDWTRAPVESDIPALLLVGEFDPITPTSFSELAAESLSHAHVVELAGVGHDAAFVPCAERLMQAFLEDSTAAPGDDCDELGAPEWTGE